MYLTSEIYIKIKYYYYRCSMCAQYDMAALVLFLEQRNY